jgi:hypothetical protein
MRALLPSQYHELSESGLYYDVIEKGAAVTVDIEACHAGRIRAFQSRGDIAKLRTIWDSVEQAATKARYVK